MTVRSGVPAAKAFAVTTLMRGIVLGQRLIMTADKPWRRLKGNKSLPRAVEGVIVTDGVRTVDQRCCRKAHLPNLRAAQHDV